MNFMRDHPFLKDTSMALRMRLAPQLVRRHAEGAAEVIEQGAEPSGSMDYLFLIAPDLSTKVEILLDGRPIAVLSGSCVFGQEAMFGVSRSFVFGARVATGVDSAAALWVIPRKVIMGLLQKDAHKEDAEILKARARETTSAILRKWFSHPMAQIRLRLFENADNAFKSALVQAVTMEVHSSGEVVRRIGDEAQDSCFCVFRGEASAYVDSEGESIAKLSHSSGTSAWAAWWGLLEVLGISGKSPAEVRTETDAVIWYLSPEALRGLRKLFPMECRLFDKVAREHTKLLQPTAPSITDAPLFSGLDAKLVAELAGAVTSEVFGVGAAIVCEGDTSDSLLFLARGRACVRRQHADRGQPGHPTLGGPGGPGGLVGEKRRTVVASKMGQLPGVSGSTRNPIMEKIIAHLPEGSFFGEATALGYCLERTASVVCETVCDVRILPGNKLLELVAAHPGLASRLLSLARQNGCRLRCEVPNRPEGEDLAVLMSLELSAEALRALDTDMGRLMTVRSQLIEKQGAGSNTLYVFVEGTVLVEVDNKCVAELPAPALLGEQALLKPGGPLQATLRSKGVCCFRTLGAERARSLLDCLPGDRDKLFRAARESLEDFIANVTGLKRNRVRSKAVMFTSEAENIDQASSSADGASSRASGEQGVQRRDSLGFEDGDDGVNFIEGRPTVVFLSRFFKESVQGFLEYILQGMHKVIFIDQEVIMREGDEGDFAVCIHRGSGTVEIGGVKVGEVKAGSLIGEAAVFGEGAKRTATVRAVGLVSAYKLPRTLLLEAFEEFPGERKHIEDLARLRGLTNKVLTAPPKKAETEDHHNPSPAPHQGRRLSRFMADANSFVFGSVSRAWSGAHAPARKTSVSRIQRAFGRSISHGVVGKSVLLPADRNPKPRGTLPAGAFRRASIDGEHHSPSSGSESSESASDDEASSGRGPHRERASSAAVEDAAEHVSNERAAKALLGRGLSSYGDRSRANSETSSCRAPHHPEILPHPEASAKCSEWVQRRRAQIRDAPLKRNQRLARRGDMLPLVPHSQGYHADEADLATQTPAWSVRLRRAEGVYAPPVWHEVYGF